MLFDLQIEDAIPRLWLVWAEDAPLLWSRTLCLIRTIPSRLPGRMKPPDVGDRM